MKKTLNKDIFKLVKEYILSNGYSPDASRCFWLPLGEDIEMHVCLNDNLQTVCCCSFFGNCTFNEAMDILVKLSKGEYKKKDHYIEFYNSEIQPNTQYCEDYGDMLEVPNEAIYV